MIHGIRFIKYFFVGGICTVVDFVIFAFLVKCLLWPWYYAAVIGFIFGTVINYVLSVKHVFLSGVRFRKSQEIALVFVVSLAGLGLNQFVLWLFITLLSVDVLLAKIGATGIVFFWNYIIRHRFVFRESALWQSEQPTDLSL